jgi:hypothetical protein
MWGRLLMTGGNSLPDYWTCERLLVGMQSIGWDKFWGRDWFQHALCVIGISEFSLAVTNKTPPKQAVSLIGLFAVALFAPLFIPFFMPGGKCIIKSRKIHPSPF